MAKDQVIPTSKPADLPTFTINSGGSEVNESYRVSSIVVSREVNRVASARIVIYDGDPASQEFSISDSDDFKPGAEIEILAGYHSEEEIIFKGIVIKQGLKIGRDKTPLLCLELKDEAVKMTIGRHNAYFEESSDSDVIEEIAGSYGLQTDVESTSVTHQELVQYYTTDWDFILSRAEKNGLVVITNDGELAVKIPDSTTEPVLNLTYGATMFAFESEMDARDQYAGVTATSWDFADQALIEAEGENPGVTEHGNVNATELADVIGLETFELQHSGHVIDEELQAWADAKLLRSRLAKVRGRVRFQGFPGVKVGNVIELAGVGERFNGNSYVSAVRHEINEKNWETDVQFGLCQEWFSKRPDVIDTPASGLVPAIRGLQIGVVVALEDDPDGEDRIQVRIPVINPEDDGVWARVATLDAGDNRGSFFRPEIEDEVVVGFLNDDPRDAVVVGMLNSSAKPAPITASDDNHEKGFFTRSEMKFVFNDDEVSVLIETPNGNKVSISDDTGGILLEDESGNKVEMTSDGITIESAADLTLKASGDIKLEGTNVEVAADAEFTADGGAGATLSTSAIATIEGSLVQIN